MKFLVSLLFLLSLSANASMVNWLFSTGPGTLQYWNQGKEVGSKYYWSKGTDAGSSFYWNMGKGPGSKNYWETGKDFGSLYFWENSTEPGSSWYWKYGTGPGSAYYWRQQTEQSFGPSFIALCMGAALKIEPCEVIRQTTLLPSAEVVSPTSCKTCPN